MNRPSVKMLSVTSILLVSCSKPYTETPVRVSSQGNKFQVYEVKKENLLPIYFLNEIDEKTKFTVIKEMVFTQAEKIENPAPTRESLSEGLSYEALKHKANAIIIVSIGDGVLNSNGKYRYYNVTIKLIQVQK